MQLIKYSGRIITEVTTILRGKISLVSHPDIRLWRQRNYKCMQKLKIFRKKLEKNYFTHSVTGSYQKLTKCLECLKKPRKLYKLATRGMLPKTTLGKKAMLKKIKSICKRNTHTPQN